MDAADSVHPPTTVEDPQVPGILQKQKNKKPMFRMGGQSPIVRAAPKTETTSVPVHSIVVEVISNRDVQAEQKKKDKKPMFRMGGQSPTVRTVPKVETVQVVLRELQNDDSLFDQAEGKDTLKNDAEKAHNDNQHNDGDDDEEGEVDANPQTWSDLRSTLAALARFPESPSAQADDRPKSAQEQEDKKARKLAQTILSPSAYSICLDPDIPWANRASGVAGTIHYLRHIYLDGAASLGGWWWTAGEWASGDGQRHKLEMEPMKRVLMELLLRGHRVTVLLPAEFEEEEGKKGAKFQTDDPALLKTLRSLRMVEFCTYKRWSDIYDSYRESEAPHAPILLASEDVLRMASVLCPQARMVRGKKWTVFRLSSASLLSAHLIGRRQPTVVFVAGTQRYDQSVTASRMMPYEFLCDEQARRKHLDPEEYRAQRDEAQLRVGTQIRVLSSLATTLAHDLPLSMRTRLDVVRLLAGLLHLRDVEGRDISGRDSALGAQVDDDDGWVETPRPPSFSDDNYYDPKPEWTECPGFVCQKVVAVEGDTRKNGKKKKKKKKKGGKKSGYGPAQP